MSPPSASLFVVAALAQAAFFAGLIDAIAGGGGIITVPCLLLAMPDPTMALGTNKGQSVFGAFSALVSFWRGGHVHARRAVPTFIAAATGAILGVRLVLSIDRAIVRPIVLVLLVAVGIVFAVRGRARPRDPARTSLESESERPPIGARHPIPVALAVGFALGAYDGFFGPGTGTFLIALYVALFGDDLTRATANAKVSNFASNLTSFITFAIAGRIDFRLALPMACAQILGGVLGARAAIRGGDRLVRRGVLLVTFALVLRIAWQIATGAT